MAKLGPYDLNSIVTGDARELAKAIPDDSVDLIFTDPVYDRIEDYEWLAETAARALKDDRACLVWSQTNLMHAQMMALGLNLSWRWLLYWYQSNNMRIYHPVFNKGVPLLWYDKGKSKCNKAFQDLRNVPLSVGNGRQDKIHKWAKNTSIVYYYLEAFTQPNDIILDPFTGGGTVPAVCKQLNRRYLAFEIDRTTADLARQRVANTQPPLPLVYPEQLPLIAEAKE